MSEQRAVPLCLPNNCKWDEQTGEYSMSGGPRESLCVIDAAIERLKSIKGPVCVVSIAGPYRGGKSYIMSKLFDQGEVFRLGHSMDPETVGIWMWIVPDKFKDSNGQEFTVVLLDSEGTDAASSDGSIDHCIFTLIVLLASVLIYNSPGVPKRTDVNQLDFIAKLSERVQLYAQTSDPPSGEGLRADANRFHKTFPFFIWLLRDARLDLPGDCHSIKDFFLKRIFNSDLTVKCNQSNQVAKSILNFFAGFDAFKVPPPPSDEQLTAKPNIDEVQQDLQGPFFQGIQEFKALLRSKLSAKRSFNDGEYVTGEALAALVNIYVSALNTRGTVPNVQSAWETFVHTKCTEAKLAALKEYERVMKSELDDLLPCDSDKIRQVQERAIGESMRIFKEETVGVSVSSSVKYLDELVGKMNESLKRWQDANNRLTKEQCSKLLRELKTKCLDPILRELRGEYGASMSFAKIIGGYSAIEQGFKRDAKGAKDVCAQEFYDFHPEMQEDMKNHMAHLEKLKDFDESLAIERQDKARQEQERQRVEEVNARLVEERRAKEKEMEILKAKQEEDIKRLEEQFKVDIEAQREQMHNMVTANMDVLQKDREAILQQNQTLKEIMEEMQLLMNKRNDQFVELQEQIFALLKKPPSPPPKEGFCGVS